MLLLAIQFFVCLAETHLCLLLLLLFVEGRCHNFISLTTGKGGKKMPQKRSREGETDVEVDTSVPYGDDGSSPLVTWVTVPIPAPRLPEGETTQTGEASMVKKFGRFLRKWFSATEEASVATNSSVSNPTTTVMKSVALRDFLFPAVGFPEGLFFTTDLAYLQRRYHPSIALGAVVRLRLLAGDEVQQGHSRVEDLMTVIGERGGRLYVVDGEVVTSLGGCGDRCARALDEEEEAAIAEGRFDCVSACCDEKLRTQNRSDRLGLPSSVVSFLQNAPDISIFSSIHSEDAADNDEGTAAETELVVLAPFAKKLPTGAFPNTYLIGWSGDREATELFHDSDGAQKAAFQSMAASVTLPLSRVVDVNRS